MADETPKVVTKTQAAQNVVNMLHDVAERVADEGDHDALIAILRALQSKPGIRSTEFWLSVLLNIVGAYLCLKPETVLQGGVMMTAATGLYTLSRAVTKVAEAKLPAVAPPPPAPVAA